MVGGLGELTLKLLPRRLGVAARGIKIIANTTRGCEADGEGCA